jgi:hypothetical protein
MAVEHDFAGALIGGFPETKAVVGLAVNPASALRESRDPGADHISALRCDEAEYLEALRIEFKRRVRDQNSR